MGCLKCTRQQRTYYGLFYHESSVQEGRRFFEPVITENNNYERYNMELCTECGTVWAGVCYEDIAGAYLFDAIALPAHVSRLMSNPTLDNLMLINDLYFAQPFPNASFNENLYYLLMKEYYLPAIEKNRTNNIPLFFQKYCEVLQQPIRFAFEEWLTRSS